MSLEFEVRLVAGIDNCFVSLPLSLIQMLQQATSSSGLLTLDLRSLSSKDSWLVSWSGASSSSSAIEVSQHFAECISLQNHVKVQVRVATNVPKATFVTIEPLTEDDWEVLELNSEHAEGAILKQVRVLHEKMKFPLWLHGQTIITFFVVSTLPAGAAVQLVPGTEVAVAPKRRAKKNNPDERSNKDESLAVGDQTQRAFLRVQDADMTLVHKSNIKNVELEIMLTSVAYIHPETAKRFSLSSLNSVTLEPSSSKKHMNANKMNLEMKSNSSRKEVNGGISTEKKETRHATVSILTSLSISIGHIMISQALRLYLGAGLHSWILVKRENVIPNRNVSLLSISPASLRLLERKEPVERKDKSGNILNERKNSMRIKDDSGILDVEDWSTHDRVIDSLTDKPPYIKESDGVANDSNMRKGLQKLVKAWLLAHLDALSSSSQEEVKSIVLGNVSLLHFELESLKSGFQGKLEPSSKGSSGSRKKGVNKPTKLLFLLTMHGDSTTSKAYEISLEAPEGKHDHLGVLEVLASKLDVAAPVSLSSIKERISNNDITSDLSSLSWMQASATEVVNRLTVLLSSASGVWFNNYSLPLPGHVLIVGPPGSGKTLLAGAVARTFENDADILAHIVFVRCSVLAREKAGDIRQKLSGCLSEALDHAPSLLVFDDLDSIISLPSELDGLQFSTSINELTEFLTAILDEYGEKRNYTCGIGPVAFVATVKSVDKVPQSLIRSGRFDFHVQLPTPASEREAILKHEINRRSLDCPQEGLQDVATKCDGYAAYDLETLVDRAIHVAKRPVLSSQASSRNKPEKLGLIKDDFTRAMSDFTPVAMRDITKSTPDGSRSGWGDVGGLHDIRSAIEEMIELPSKFQNIFGGCPLRLRSNVLLYGPPGCGKTHIVGAAAAACSLRFISVKGPELLNKYIGASEQAVRDVFSKAAAAAPCILFFDEFDSIAPKRGHDNTGVTDRVVNQFLTELDGVEVLTGVFVFAATSRPDLLDAALLRPGRLDRLLFCDFPSKQDRLDILRVLSSKLPLERDVDLEGIANMTEGFSGADLQALLSDAEIAAVHHHLQHKQQQEAEGSSSIKISDDVLKSIASKARPSVADSEKDRLYSIYNQFLDSKRSTSAQTRDAKGKRATLA